MADRLRPVAVLHRFTTPVTTVLHVRAVSWARTRARGGHDALHHHSVISRLSGCPRLVLVPVTSWATGTPTASPAPGAGAGSSAVRKRRKEAVCNHAVRTFCYGENRYKYFPSAAGRGGARPTRAGLVTK